MITSEQVIENLKGNKDLIISILDDFDFFNISDNGKTIRCGLEKNSNPTSILIDIDTLKTTCFSRNINGFYNLLMFKTNQEFLVIHNLLLSYIDTSLITEAKPIKPLFGGFFENFSLEEEIHYYSESNLNSFKKIASKRLYEDNIFPYTQQLFDVRYDYKSNRIVIPWRGEYNELIGCTGRINKDDVDENIPKYIALLPFQKRNFVYGLNVTGKYIDSNKLCVVFESEKSVMKSFQSGVRCSVAVGCHNISDSQCKLLSKYCDKIILAYDEGVTEEEIIPQANRLKGHFKSVGYVFDKENKYLEKDCKLSPADLPTKQFKQCLKECLVKL